MKLISYTGSHPNRHRSKRGQLLLTICDVHIRHQTPRFHQRFPIRDNTIEARALKVFKYAKLGPAISCSHGRNRSNIKQSRNHAMIKYETVPEERIQEKMGKGTGLYRF
jgi:hypothetical protein